MSAVDSLSSLLGQKTPAVTRPNDELGQNEFLKLMVAQLKNQDPTKPLDPSEFLGQLAQFSSVTSMQRVEGSLADLSTTLRSSAVLSGTSLVGHDVLASNSEFALTSGAEIKAAAEVPAGAQSVQVSIRDKSGQLVRTFPVEPTAGLANITWNGTADNGTTAPSGTYEIEVIASVNGQSASLEPLVQGRVTSVTFDPTSNDLTLNTNNGPLTLNSVRRVM